MFDRQEEVHYGSDGNQMNKPVEGSAGYIKMCSGHTALLIQHGKESISLLPGAGLCYSLDKRNLMLPFVGFPGVLTYKSPATWMQCG